MYAKKHPETRIVFARNGQKYSGHENGGLVGEVDLSVRHTQYYTNILSQEQLFPAFAEHHRAKSHGNIAGLTDVKHLHPPRDSRLVKLASNFYQYHH